MLKRICTGAIFPTTTTFTTDSGIVISTYYLEPLIVTEDNATDLYADNEELLSEFNGDMGSRVVGPRTTELGWQLPHGAATPAACG
jgi:hypothetical protein